MTDTNNTDDITPEAEAESEAQAFRVVTHKPGTVTFFAPFGATQDIGVSVDADKAAQDLWWMSQDWAVQVLQAGIELPQLTAPTPGWVAGLDQKWLNREVGTLLKRDIPRFFAQHPEYCESHPQVVISIPAEHTELVPDRLMSSEQLAAGEMDGLDGLPDDMLLQIDSMMACVVEVRCWIANGELTVACPYRLGMIGWDSTLFLEMLFNSQGQELTQTAARFAQELAASVEGPPGYAVDIGVTLEGTPTVLRSWPAWAADPLSAEPSAVFAALAASHDFDQTHQRWRWNPDMRAYARLSPSEDAPEAPTIEPTEDQESSDE